MRTAIQNKITEICEKGTFPKVSYDKGSYIAKVSETDFIKPSSIAVNEISGSLAASVANSPRARSFTYSTWVFEARIKFTSEVSLDYFLDNEVTSLVLLSEGGIKARTTGIGYNIAHPPRQGSHNGTEAVITYTLTTRR